MNQEENKTRPDMKWYIVHVFSGFENKVKSGLEERIRAFGQEEYFGRIIIPTEQVVELKKGQKKTSTRKYYPGYIMVQMVLNDATWHTVKNTPKTTGFVGGEVTPTPVPDEEVERIIRQMEEGFSRPKPKFSFEEGEEIHIIDGPFAGFKGVVSEVNQEKEKIKVLVTIFGRPTSVELDFIQIKKG